MLCIDSHFLFNWEKAAVTLLIIGTHIGTWNTSLSIFYYIYEHFFTSTAHVNITCSSKEGLEVLNKCLAEVMKSSPYWMATLAGQRPYWPNPSPHRKYEIKTCWHTDRFSSLLSFMYICTVLLSGCSSVLAP